MNANERKVTYHASPLWVVLAVLGFLLCIGVVYYYYDTSTANDKRKKTLQNNNRTLQTSNAGMVAEFSDQRAEKVRKDSDAIRAAMLTSAEADAFISSLRPSWSVLSRTDEDKGEYWRRRIQIVKSSAPVSVWPEVEAVIDRIQGVNAMAMGGVEIQTVGDNRKREFSRITFTLYIYVRKPNPTPAGDTKT